MPEKEIAVVNFSSIDNEAIALAVAACDIQLHEQLRKTWPQLTYIPPRFYPAAEALPPVDRLARLVTVNDTLDRPSVPAYETIRSIVLAQGDYTSVMISQELLGLIADPECSRWIRRPGKAAIAFEICAPCEGASYTVEVTGLAAPRPVKVARFVVPSWFRPNGDGAFMTSPGGFTIHRDAEGRVYDDWPNVESATLMRRALLRANSTSRLYRRGVR